MSPYTPLYHLNFFDTLIIRKNSFQLDQRGGHPFLFLSLCCYCYISDSSLCISLFYFHYRNPACCVKSSWTFFLCYSLFGKQKYRTKSASISQSVSVLMKYYPVKVFHCVLSRNIALIVHSW